MADASYAITGFLGGEISQFAQARFDKPDYRISLNVCYNAFPAEIGPWCRRPGTQFAGATRLGRPARVIEWAFEQALPVTLEFTDGAIRFRNGPRWLTTNDGQTVTGMSTADPAVVAVAAAWPTGSTVFFSNLGTNIPLLQNRQFLITNLSATTFSIQDALSGLNIDGSALGPLVTGFSASRIQEILTPYFAGSWATVRMVQAETVGLLLHGSYAPQALTVPTLPNSGSDAQFAIAAADLNDGPYLDPFINGAQVIPNQTTGIVTLSLSFPAYAASTSYAIGDFVTSSSVNYESLVDQNIGNTPVSSPAKWVAVSSGAAINPPPGQPNAAGRGFLTTDIGRLVRLFSEPPLWAASGSYSAGAVVAYNPGNAPGASTYWQSLVGTNNAIPGADITSWQIVAPGATLPTLPDGTQSINAGAGPAQWTWGKIVSLATFIPGAPSGIAYVGNATSKGGLSAAFNGITAQPSASSAMLSVGSSAQTIVSQAYVGQNFAGATPASYIIASATMYPPTDAGLVQWRASVGGSTNLTAAWTVTAYLFASNSPPSSWNNGTQLGSSVVESGTGSLPHGFITTNNFGLNAVTIQSNDLTNAYAYVWMACVSSVAVGGNLGGYIAAVDTAFAQVQSTTTTTATSSNGIDVELFGPPLLTTTTIREWRLGAYSNTTGWPTCGTYAGGRLWLSGAIANRFDACYANGINGAEINFAPTDQFGTVTDAHAIDYTLNSDGVNPIYWMKPIIQNQSLRGIIMETQAREWFVFPPGQGGFSPVNIDAVPATHVGGSNVLPVETEHTTIFVQRYSVKLMEYFPDIFSGKFTAPNLADKAQHITRAGIAEIAYVYATAPMLWGRDSLGNLFGMNYKRDTLMSSSGPTYYAWHRHALGSGRIVVSITSGASAGGNLDALTMVTQLPNAVGLQYGLPHVEILTNTLDELATLVQSWFLDDAVLPSSYTSSTTAVSYSAWAAGTTYSAGQIITYIGGTYISLTSGNVGNIPSTSTTNWLATFPAPYGGTTLNGLWHLNGQRISITCGSLDCGDYVVVNGSVFVPFGDGISGGTGAGLFTDAFVATTPPFVVGFTYNSDGQLVRPQSPQDTGARNGPSLGKKRRVQQAAAQLSNVGVLSNSSSELALSFGTSFTNLRPAIVNYSSTSSQTGSIAPLQAFNGIWFDTIQDESSFDGMVCWRVSRPLPANIVALECFLQTQDK